MKALCHILGGGGNAFRLFLAVWVLAVATSCGFPDYDFVDDAGQEAGALPAAEQCDNGLDDDEDGDIDCLDSDCDPCAEEDCDNGLDDDEDGDIDCLDSDCDPCVEEDCDNGLDDDEDGDIDCLDSDCDPCPEEDCDNGLDDDEDGDIDCADLDCDCPERCDNGVDDDRDLLADCEDLECACVAPLPEGWQGPVSFWLGPDGDQPTCQWGTPYPLTAYSGYADVVEPSWECPACTCGPPTGVECQATVNYWSDPQCGVETCWPVGSCGYLVTQACTTVVLDYASAGNITPVATKSTFAGASGGSCAPSESPVELEPATWRAVVACGGAVLSTTTCPESERCVARPAEGFLDGVCIFRAGEQVCPAGYEARRQITYQDFDDTRACLPCQCGAPDVQGCDGAIVDSGGPSCDGIGNRMGFGQCMQLSPPPSLSETERHVYFDVTDITGSCAASGGDETGGVQVVGATTFCCSAP